MAKATFKELQYFYAVINSIPTKEDTKPKEYVVSTSKKLDKDIWTDYNSEVESLKIKHCAVDKTTEVILKDKDGAFEFTRDGMTKFKEEVKALSLKTTEYNIRSYPLAAFVDLIDEDTVVFLTDFGFLEAEETA